MKRFSNSAKLITFLIILSLSFVACDRDFTTIESDIEGITNFNTDSFRMPVVAYNKKLGPVQTNNLSSNLLGIYNDPVYGKTKASFVAQVAPTVYNFDFPDNAVIDSVMLTVPYYSKSTGTDDNGENTFKLDSLFGNDPIKLTIHQNNYFLRDLDPESNLSEPQNYYSNANQTINFDNFVGQLLYSDGEYFPSSGVQNVAEGEKAPPSLRVDLSGDEDNPIVGLPEFWHDLLFALPEGAPELSNQNNFKDYFRGLYFKVEDIGNNGHIMMLNFSLANIVVHYSYIEITTDENGDDVEEEKTGRIVLNFTGNLINIFENDPSNSIVNNADTNADMVNGDQSLFIKGGEGSIAVLDLFNGTIEDPESGLDIPALDYFKDKKDSWLINEANLTLYVDQSQVNGQEPDRVMLMDLKNNVPIVDYYFDSSTNNANPLKSKNKYSKLLERDSDGNGYKYKFRLTEHLNNILLRDSTNVKLGVYVSTNVNEIQKASALEYDDIETLSGSVLSPRGTVLHGTNQNVPEDKQIKFEIFFTEPDK